MTFGSLFTGIGGIDLGLERAGMQVVWQVEIDPFCQQVLRKHWPHVPRFGDVRQLTGDELAPVDLIAGGPPCQPVSVAGRMRGEEDPRWLWPEFARIVRYLRPRYILMENVPGLLVRGMGRVLGDLAELGYDAEWASIPAAAFGAPHLRYRVFIVAYPSGAGARRLPVRPGRPFKTQTHTARTSKAPADPDGQRCDGWPHIFPTVWSSGSYDVERNHAWSVEPDVGGTLDGFSAWLDRHWELLAEAYESMIADGGDDTSADALKTRAREALRVLRRETGEAALRRQTGGHGRISSQEVLFAYLCKLEEASQELDNVSLESSAIQERPLRGMRSKNEPTSASHRPESREQLAREHSNTLQALSRLLARHAEKAWAQYRWENAAPVLARWLPGWEDGFERLAYGIPHRMDRLRALGNAVVPQVAEWVGRQILTFEAAMYRRVRGALRQAR